MCLAAIAIGQSKRYPFVLASNRDEYFSRPSQPLAWWQPPDSGLRILSGRDLSGGGTWMGLSAAGRLALVTNVREPGGHLVSSRSRGELVLQCLAEPDVDLTALAETPRNGFNLVAVDLWACAAKGWFGSVGQWVSNRPVVQQQRLATGTFGLSNASLDTPWPKVQKLKRRLLDALDRHEKVDDLQRTLFTALADPSRAADAELPRTGVTKERERQLSSAFIRIEGGKGGAYGTRCSTVVLLEVEDGRSNVHVFERTHDEAGEDTGLQGHRFELALQP